MAKQNALEKRAAESTALATHKLDIEALLHKAAENGMSVEGLERLVALRERLKAEAAREAFFASLAAFQAKCPSIEKTEPVFEKGKPHVWDPQKPATRANVRYFFAPLEVIEAEIAPSCKKFGFSYTFGTKVDVKNGEIAAVCNVHHVGGHTESTDFPIPVDTNQYMSAPQRFASSLSFSKRYALIGAFGLKIVGEDTDDGGAAGKTAPPRTDPVTAPRAREAAPSGQEAAPAPAPVRGSRDLRQPSAAPAGAPGKLIGEKINATQVGIIEKKMEDAALSGGEFYKRFGIMSVGDLKPTQLQEALDWIKDPVANGRGAS